MATAKRKYKADFVRLAFSRWFVGEESADGEQRMFCPVCEDPDTSNSPSAMMNPGSGVWNCLKGSHGGSIVGLAADLKKERGWSIRSAAMEARNADPESQRAREEGLARAGRRAAPLPSVDQIEAWASRLLADRVTLDRLISERGFDQQTIVEYEIGWDGSRYTFPVYNADGDLLNVRRYRLNAGSANDKMLNLPGHGQAQMFHPEIIQQNKHIIVSEGEPDMVLTNQYLRGVDDYGAVTHTAGAATFRPAWGPLFAGKIVYICYDNDDGGKRGASKVSSILKPYAESVYNVTIPIPVKGADLTDYFHKEGHSTEDFLSLLKETAEGTPIAKSKDPVAGKGIKMSLLESMSEEHQDDTVEIVVSVSGKQQEPYVAPKAISVTCSMDKGVACTLCPVAANNGELRVELRADDPEVFRYVDSSEERRKKLMREATGARCSDRSEYEIEGDYHIEELLVQPSVDDRTDAETQIPVRRTAFSVGTYKSNVNEKVRLVGRNVIDPKTSKLRFMSWVNEHVDMDIDNIVLTDELRERLQQFQPDAEQTPLDKCLEIAGDLSDNVTHIYGRDLLHVAMDLVWHSVLSFRVNDMTVDKGWLEMAVVGDTRTGKSEIAKKLIKHYNAGRLLSCEGVTFAGIVGGVQQIDGRWHMTWGAVPMNDRRLVVLDEVSGMKDNNVIDQMSSIRSSGIAQITKISSESTSARTRLVWISNPADGSMLDDHPEVGMWALRSIVPNAEDIARFDYVTSASRGDVDTRIINSTFAERHTPEHSSEDCESLVKWIWSLTRDDVIISKQAAEAANKEAILISDRYTDSLPLIQQANVRWKLLRIACALAARTFSVSPRGKLFVKPEHVKDAVRFLDMLYSSESMGYARLSRQTASLNARAAERREVARAFLQQHEDTVLHTLQQCAGQTFKLRDFEEMGGMTREEAKPVVSKLLSWGMIKRKTRGDMEMTAVLTRLLRDIEDSEL